MDVTPDKDVWFVQRLADAQRGLYAYILQLLPNRADADDVLQATNLVMWSKRLQFVEGSNFAAWAARIAYYEVLTFRKQKGRDRLRFDGNDTLTTASATAFNVGSSGDVTYFAVFMANDVSERGLMGSAGDVNPCSRFGLFFLGSWDALRYHYFGDDRATVSGLSTETYYIAEGLRNGTSLSDYVDGSLAATDTGVSNVVVTATKFTVGTMVDMPDLDGDIAEIIIYNRTSTPCLCPTARQSMPPGLTATGDVADH